MVTVIALQMEHFKRGLQLPLRLASSMPMINTCWMAWCSCRPPKAIWGHDGWCTVTWTVWKSSLGCEVDTFTHLNRIKMRNWYIMSPMKTPKQQFCNFCMKFSIYTYHRRRNFLNFWLREGGKEIWIFAGFLWLLTRNSLWKSLRIHSLLKV